MQALHAQKSTVALWYKPVGSLVVLFLFISLSGALNAAAGTINAGGGGSAATKLYAINIASYPEPFDRSVLVPDRALKRYRLYTIKVKSGGRNWRGLRIGFFESREEAQRALRALPEKYAGAWVVKATAGELRLAARKAKSNGTGGVAGARGGTVKSITGYFANLIETYVPKKSDRDKGVEKAGKRRLLKSSNKAGKRAGKTQRMTNGKSGPLYSINIASYPEPFDRSVLVPDRALKRYRLYTIKVKSGGRNWRGLRIGFFESREEAQRALRALPEKYDGAWVVKATAGELRLAARKAKSNGIGGVLRVKNGAVGAGFDHFRTGFPLTGGHERVRCESCHGRGLFKGTPSKCVACHTPGGRVAATGKSRSHISTGAACDQCHLTAAWSSVRFDHGSVSGSCATCHNNVTAPGKSVSHISSSNTCDECHSTNTWGAARFDHFSVSGKCATCHNGRKATGKPGSHIQSSNTCSACHSPGASWASARFDHSSVTGKCATCHNGRKATGKPGSHIQSSNTCSACHSPGASWASARFDHSSVTGQCASCHNGRKATGKSPGHFVTSVQCNECHSTKRWSSTNRYRHNSGAYPGDHRSKVVCLKCHKGNNQNATWTSPAYRPDCAGCHASDYKTSKHKKVSSPRIYYTVGELRDCAGACHRYTDSSMTTRSKTRNSKHKVSKGGF